METTPAGLKKTIFEQIRERFFYSSQATGITVVACFVLALILWRLVDWAVLDAVFRADPNACYQASGACWGFVAEKWRLIIFGRLPYDARLGRDCGIAEVRVFWQRVGLLDLLSFSG